MYTQLINQLVAKYPAVEPEGQATSADIENEYQKVCEGGYVMIGRLLG